MEAAEAADLAEAPAVAAALAEAAASAADPAVDLEGHAVDITADLVEDFTEAPSLAADFSVPDDIITDMATEADASAACWEFLCFPLFSSWLP